MKRLFPTTLLVIALILLLLVSGRAADRRSSAQRMHPISYTSISSGQSAITGIPITAFIASLTAIQN